MERIRRVRHEVPQKNSLEETYDEDSESQEQDERQEGESEDEACSRIIDKYKDRATTPLKAIRAFCISCMGGQVRMVGRCSAPECVLYGYRMGTKPKKSGEEDDE